MDIGKFKWYVHNWAEELLTADGVKVKITYGAPKEDMRVENEEIAAYIMRGRKMEPNRKLVWIDIAVEGDEVAIHYGYEPEKFERIRRITGYLVGSLDRFNDAKRAEESQRVKHSIPGAAK